MKKSGFTLIELIFVIVIIGLLAAVAVPKFLTTKKNAETANFPEVANQIVTKATEQYSFTGDHDLGKIIDRDPDLKRYFNKIDKNDTKFRVAKDSDDFNITYKKDATTTYNCLVIKAETYDVNVSSKATTSAYDFNITELNTSCNQD